MAFTIAVAGKGGTGKTTLAGFLINYLVEKGCKPVLGVDADPSANLNDVLGEEVEITLGEVRDDVSIKNRDGKLPGGMTRAEYINYQLQRAVIEGSGFDLLVMGRPEGQGCYCFANGILREATDRFANSYKYMVIDNEAGLEHLSRRTTKSVDIMFTVSECSKRGIDAAGRVKQLIAELELEIGQLYLVVNRVPEEGISRDILDVIDRHGLTLAGTVPLNNEIFDFDNKGKPLVDIPKDNAAIKAMRCIFDEYVFGYEGDRC